MERLATTFRDKGCHTRAKLQNHIPVSIDQRLLDRALQKSRFPAERLVADAYDNYPKLEFPSDSRVECLHGQARVRAAIQVLPAGERFWTADFYTVGMLHSLLNLYMNKFSRLWNPGPSLAATSIEEYATNE